MNTSIKVSVLIPVYNVEDYVEECVRSVMSQTYSNLQIIILNDGSTDNSYEICKKLSKEDNRIELYSQDNSGLSNARNNMIQYFTGDYFLFLDSDDFISLFTIERMVNAIEVENAQCVCVSYTRSINKIDKKTGNPKIYTGAQYAELMTRPNGLFCFAWGRLIKKDFISNIFFPESYLFEDLFTMPKLLYPMDKIVQLPDKLWFYRKRNNSISKSRFTFASTDEMDGYISVVTLGDFYNDKKIITNGILFFLTKYYWYSIKTILTGLNISKYKDKYRPYAKWYLKRFLTGKTYLEMKPTQKLEQLR